MSVRRLTLVNKVFARLDHGKKGFISYQDLEDFFNPSSNPSAVSEKEALSGIKLLMDPKQTGRVSKEDFVNFYRNVSAGVDTNEQFNRIINGTWLDNLSQNKTYNKSFNNNNNTSTSRRNAWGTNEEKEADLNDSFGSLQISRNQVSGSSRRGSSRNSGRSSVNQSGSSSPRRASRTYNNNNKELETSFQKSAWPEDDLHHSNSASQQNSPLSSPQRTNLHHLKGGVESRQSRSMHQSHIFQNDKSVQEEQYHGRKKSKHSLRASQLSSENPFATQYDHHDSPSPKKYNRIRTYPRPSTANYNPIKFEQDEPVVDPTGHKGHFHSGNLRARSSSFDQPWVRQNTSLSANNPMITASPRAVNTIRAKERGIALTSGRAYQEEKEEKPWRSENPKRRGDGVTQPKGSQVSKHSLRSEEDSKLLAEVRDVILARSGKDGISGLGRFFRRSDRNGDGNLSAKEIQDTLAIYGIRMTFAQCKGLLKSIDRDNSGKVSYNELLRELRGVLTARRRELVETAFNKFDRDGDGQVDFKDLAGVFDASKHPDVISGKLTEKAVFDKFLGEFEQYGDRDGIVTREEFIEYYRWISSNIDKDDYFELTIRNAWHLPGGKGQFENTANLRVCVTFIDGSQKIIALDDDLGLGSHPSTRVLTSKLRRQGVTNIQKVQISS